MDLIKYPKLNANIGFDIGNGIMNILLKNGSLIPCKYKESFIIDDEDQKNISIFYGNHNQNKFNIHLVDMLIKSNKLYFLTVNLINEYFLIFQLEDKLNILNKTIFKFKNKSIIINKNNINQNIINHIKISHMFKVLKKKIIKKLNCKKSNFPDILKKNIIIKLNNFDNNIETFETQKIMDKIILLKETFIL
uniref:Uncharacterized protein n=1 Tax=viral metagenome TaxID=1070528 RepID=A0A6C0J3D9_9ZZZZ